MLIQDWLFISSLSDRIESIIGQRTAKKMANSKAIIQLQAIMPFVKKCHVVDKMEATEKVIMNITINSIIAVLVFMIIAISLYINNNISGKKIQIILIFKPLFYDLESEYSLYFVFSANLLFNYSLLV